MPRWRESLGGAVCNWIPLFMVGLLWRTPAGCAETSPLILSVPQTGPRNFGSAQLGGVQVVQGATRSPQVLAEPVYHPLNSRAQPGWLQSLPPAKRSRRGCPGSGSVLAQSAKWAGAQRYPCPVHPGSRKEKPAVGFPHNSRSASTVPRQIACRERWPRSIHRASRRDLLNVVCHRVLPRSNPLSKQWRYRRPVRNRSSATSASRGFNDI